MQHFEQHFFESIIEYFIYREFTHCYLNEKYDKSFFYPMFYYRHRELSTTYFSRSTLKLKNTQELTTKQKAQVKQLVAKIKEGEFDFKKYTQKQNKKFLFIFDEEGQLQNPEFLNQKEISRIERSIKSGEKHLFMLQALSVNQARKHFQEMRRIFKEILRQDPQNPFFLARYSRYLGSNFSSPINLKKCETMLLDAIKNYPLKTVPSFFYGRLGFLYYVQKKYELSLQWFEKCCRGYKLLGRVEPEPTMAQAKLLCKMKRYKDSYALLSSVLSLDGNIEKNISYYAFICEVCFFVGDIGLFKKYLLLGVNLLLSSKKPVVFIGERELSLASLDGGKHGGIGKGVSLFSSLFKRKINGEHIIFSNSKGIIRLAYIYTLLQQKVDINKLQTLLPTLEKYEL